MIPYINKRSHKLLKNDYSRNGIAGNSEHRLIASAAKYVATACMEVYHDMYAYDTGMVVILETMGRNAGWLAASTALAGHMGFGPDLIYLPEIPFDPAAFAEKAAEIYRQKGKCIAVVSEGICDAEGKYISEYGKGSSGGKDSFGHAQMGGGLAAYLAGLVKAKTGAKVRGIELNLPQRCGAHCASGVDIEESFMAGQAAVQYAAEGVTDKMVGFERVEDGGQYACRIKLFELAEVANTEKKVPREWITPSGDGVTEAFIRYALPLIQGESPLCREDGLPRFVHLKKVEVK